MTMIFLRLTQATYLCNFAAPVHFGAYAVADVVCELRVLRSFFRHLSPIALSLLISLGCGTVLSPQSVQISVLSEPRGAIVRVDDRVMGNTPTDVTVPANATNHNVTVELPGEAPVALALTRVFEPNSAWNFAFLYFAPVGFLIDLGADHLTRTEEQGFFVQSPRTDADGATLPLRGLAFEVEPGIVEVDLAGLPTVTMHQSLEFYGVEQPLAHRLVAAVVEINGDHAILELGRNEGLDGAAAAYPTFNPPTESKAFPQLRQGITLDMAAVSTSPTSPLSWQRAGGEFSWQANSWLRVWGGGVLNQLSNTSNTGSGGSATVPLAGGLQSPNGGGSQSNSKGINTVTDLYAGLSLSLRAFEFGLGFDHHTQSAVLVGTSITGTSSREQGVFVMRGGAPDGLHFDTRIYIANDENFLMRGTIPLTNQIDLLLGFEFMVSRRSNFNIFSDSFSSSNNSFSSRIEMVMPSIGLRAPIAAFGGKGRLYFSAEGGFGGLRSSGSLTCGASGSFNSCSWSSTRTEAVLMVKLTPQW